MAKKKCVRIISDDLSLSVSLSFVANVSPSVSALEETLSTLKFAQRAKTVKNTSSVQEETIGSVQALQQELRRAKAELLRLQSEGCAAGDALGKVVENLDEESRNHLDKVRSLLASERDAHQEERGRLAAEVESLRGLAKKLETSLKSTKLVVRLREQNLERLQGKLPPAPAEFWREQGGAAIRENEELKVQLECHPEVVKCRMEIEQLGRENGRLKERLEQEVESQIFVFKENAKTAMEELHFLIKDREALQTEHNQLSAEHDRLKEDNFLDLQGAFDKLEATMNANEDLKGKNERAGQEAGKLRDEVAALEAALEEATRTIERTRRAYEEVQADLAAHAKMCDELSDNVMEITNRLSTMQKQKETVEASFETLKSEMDAQKEAHNNECTQLSDQIQTVQQEKESVKANMESLKSEIAAKTQAHNDECTELNGQIKTIQEQKETVEASFDTLKSEMDAQKEAHKLEMDGAAQKIGDLQSLVDELTMMATRIESEESAYVEKVQTLEKELAEKSGILEQSHEVAVKAEEEAGRLRSDLANLRESYDAAQEDLAALRASNEDSVAELRSELSAAAQRYENAAEEAKAEASRQEGLREELEDSLKSVISGLEADLQSARQDRMSVEANMESLKSEIAAKTQAHNDECTELNGQIKTIQQEKETVEASFETLKSEMDAQKEAHNNECTQLSDQIQTVQQEKQSVEAKLAALKSDVAAQREASNRSRADEAKILELESALAKARQAEAELKMKTRESLSSCNTAMEEVKKLEAESSRARKTEEDLEDKLREAEGELQRFKRLYAESQQERQDLERERSSLASQLDSECEKRQAAIMAKVQSESKLSEAREEARESADQLREDLEEASADRERLRRRVRELEIDVARSQSPSTPANDENRIARSASLMLGSAQRRPFGDASNRIKSIELTPQGKEQRSKQGEKTRQLHKVKAHLSAIESAISSRSSSRYALRTRNRVTYKE